MKETSLIAGVESIFMKTLFRNPTAFVVRGGVTVCATVPTAEMKRTAFVLLDSFNVAAIEVETMNFVFSVFRNQNSVMELKIVRVTKTKEWGNAHSTAQHLEKVSETFQGVTENEIAKTLVMK